jgi:hypothetical protein
MDHLRSRADANARDPSAMSGAGEKPANYLRTAASSSTRLPRNRSGQEGSFVGAVRQA